jgi:dihydroorotate dehydrogenase
VGANIGKNRDTVDPIDDYKTGIHALVGLADYIVVNISSPNTPGLRALQAREAIRELLGCVLEVARQNSPASSHPPPILVKIGPDLTDQQMHDIAEVALAIGVDGLVIGNTTVERPLDLASRHKTEAGGLSGLPLKVISTACLATMYRLTEGRIPIIGCGGIASGGDAYAKIRAGASLVQIYSALVFEGPQLVMRVKKELADRLRADGFCSVSEAVGADHI